MTDTRDTLDTHIPFPIQYKHCPRCHTTKPCNGPDNAFYIRKTGKYTRPGAYCKQCDTNHVRRHFYLRHARAGTLDKLVTKLRTHLTSAEQVQVEFKSEMEKEKEKEKETQPPCPCPTLNPSK